MVERIPAEPPIQGAFWTVVVPALLLAFSFLATLLLYRRFIGSGHSDRPHHAKDDPR